MHRRHVPTTHFVLQELNTCFQAVSEGIFAEEILPVEIRGAVISVDDTVRPGVTLESLAKLKPAFLEDGASTAGNGHRAVL